MKMFEEVPEKGGTEIALCVLIVSQIGSSSSDLGVGSKVSGA